MTKPLGFSLKENHIRQSSFFEKNRDLFLFLMSPKSEAEIMGSSHFTSMVALYSFEDNPDSLCSSERLGWAPTRRPIFRGRIWNADNVFGIKI